MWDLSSPIRDWTHIPCIAIRILYHWATREVPTKMVFSGVCQPRHTLVLWPSGLKQENQKLPTGFWIQTRGSSMKPRRYELGHRWLPRFQLHGGNRCEEKKVLPTQQGVVYVWWWCGLDGQITGAGSTWVPSFIINEGSCFLIFLRWSYLGQ